MLLPCKQLQCNTCLHPSKGNCRVGPVLYSFSAWPEQWVFLVLKPITDGESSCLLHGLCTLIAVHLSLFKPNILTPKGTKLEHQVVLLFIHLFEVQLHAELSVIHSVI